MDLTAPTVAVLGTGRMGAAMASRLASRFPVCTWSRSGRQVRGVPAMAASGEAVSRADVALLCLYDGTACREVLTGCLPGLSAGSTVVTTATVSIDEAGDLAGFAAAHGVTYLHAPVMGSVPAVRAGELVILAGGAVPVPARQILDHLGTLVHLGDPREAAALKLIANGVLADALDSVRRALLHARRLGMDPSRTLDVLGHTPVGGLVQAKRDQIQDTGQGGGTADFTVEALLKDQRLLAAATGTAGGQIQFVAGLLRDARLRPDDDIAALCKPQPPGRNVPDGILGVSPEVADADDDVLAPLHAYARGHATGDPAYFRAAFLPSAHIEGNRDGRFISWDLDSYCSLFGGPAPDEAGRSRTVDGLRVDHDIATATMTLRHGADTFTDKFVLIRVPGGWRIANKVYHRLAKDERG